MQYQNNGRDQFLKPCFGDAFQNAFATNGAEQDPDRSNRDKRP